MVGYSRKCLAIFRYHPKRQSGMVLTEYFIGTALVAVALFAPIPAVGESTFEFLLGAVRSYQANSTFLLSMP